MQNKMLNTRLRKLLYGRVFFDLFSFLFFDILENGLWIFQISYGITCMLHVIDRIKCRW